MASVLTEDSVEFQDGAGNSVQLLSPGDAALFYVRDGDLVTSGTCTGTWTNVGIPIDAGTRLSLATGAPDAASYSLNEGCAYDGDAPNNTPLKLDPIPTASVDEVASRA